jgi:transcriptional regulator with GAF, ATPase, and Fis domain
LRDRREDIPALVAHFVETLSRRVGRQIDSIPDKTMMALCSYDWPGNIRELQNMIERAVILSEDGVLPNPLLTVGTQQIAFSPAPTTLIDSERALILRTLESAGWVIGGRDGAAARLGVKRTSLIYKMQRLGISRPSFDVNLEMAGNLFQDSGLVPQVQ